MAFTVSRCVFSKISRVAKFNRYGAEAAVAFSWCRKSSSATYAFKTLSIKEPHEHVLHVELNRPEKLNSMNTDFWREYLECFKAIQKDKTCRAVVVSGAGKAFTSGLDFSAMQELASQESDEDDIGRKAFAFQNIISSFQDSFSSMEQCSKPVIVAVHGICLGAGLDLICSADIRYCSEDAYFQAKEVDIGLAADVGTLQRFPRIVGNDSFVREVVYTARKISSAEALKVGLVSEVYPTKEETLQKAIELAKLIASKSPIAVQGSKVNMIYSRDHGVPDGLRFMSNWNMSMLQSEDLVKGAMAALSRTSEQPEYTNL